MKLIIQIPCYNEEKTLPQTIKDLPEKVKGIDIVEYLVIDDGSTDKTAEIAKKCGVHHVISLVQNKGLANAFRTGLTEALKLGADIIVNTDADNQYKGADIPKLIEPVLKGRAQIVVGERPIINNPDFSPIKKVLQKLGSWVVRILSGTKVPDAPSGFRAYSKEAALRLNVLSKYTYTLETIIQAGRNGIPIESVKIRTNPKVRESRLFKNMFQYIYRSVITMIRMFAVYSPFLFFSLIGGAFLVFGGVLFVRFICLVYWMPDVPMRTHLPSVVVGSSSVLMGILMIAIGFLAEIISHNRKLEEDILYRMKKDEIEK